MSIISFPSWPLSFSLTHFLALCIWKMQHTDLDECNCLHRPKPRRTEKTNETCKGSLWELWIICDPCLKVYINWIIKMWCTNITPVMIEILQKHLRNIRATGIHDNGGCPKAWLPLCLGSNCYSQTKDIKPIFPYWYVIESFYALKSLIMSP